MLFLPSQCGCHIYIYIFLIALAKNSSIMLNRSGEREHSCLVCCHGEEIINFSLLSMMLTEARCPMRLKNFHCILSLLRFFILDRFWILLNAFSPSVDKIMWFFSSYLIQQFLLIDFHTLNQSCISGIISLGCDVFLEEAVQDWYYFLL